MKISLLFSILAISLLPTMAWGQKEGQFTDKRDSITYKTIAIGNQIWMAENLRFDTIRSWCEKCEENGRIYQYKGALAAIPEGWHLPSDAEWKELFDYLGGDSAAITKMTLWNNPDNKAYNGFNLKPAPYRGDDQKIHDGGHTITYATSTVANDKMYYTIEIDCNKKSTLTLGRQFTYGVSVRCVKDYNDTYFPVSSEEAKKFVDDLEARIQHVKPDLLNLYISYYSEYMKNSNVDIDFKDLEKKYKAVIKNDKSVLEKMQKLKEIDTTMNMKLTFENTIKANINLTEAFHSYFQEIEASRKSKGVSVVFGPPILLYYEQLNSQVAYLKKKSQYFHKKYGIE